MHSTQPSRRTSPPTARLLIVAAVLIAAGGSLRGLGNLHADSAIELLAGFDAQRLREIIAEEPEPMEAEPATDELAKLLYRLGRLEPNSVQRRVTASRQIGDAVEVSGTIRSTRSLPVTEPLSELLEMRQIRDMVLDLENGGELRLFSSDVPANASVGDQLRGAGVLIGGGDSRAGADDDGAGADDDGASPAELVVAAAGMAWVPAEPSDVGWQLLSEAGVDLSLLPEVAARDREPLTAEDADAFYAMLATAKQIGTGHAPGPDAESLPRPAPVEPIELLQAPQGHVGRWLQLRLDTVRVTRVSLHDQPQRQEQLGQDHFFQIDAIGDLGNVEVQIPAAEPGAEPVRFKNRYPVTLVAATLPDFLRAEIERTSGPRAVVAPVSIPVEVDGFFYRLWSYESDFMSRRGEDQFGPLFVAARWQSRQLTERDPAGVARIGWWAAGGVLIGVALIILWATVTARRDARVREQRRSREAEQTSWPPRTS